MLSRSLTACLVGSALAVLALGGCAAATDGAPGADEGDSTATADELRSRLPIPYILQFVGTYVNAGATSGQVKSLTLARTGRYTASIAGSTKVERGSFFSVSHLSGKPSDNTLHMVTTGLGWTATIEGYTSKLQLARTGDVTHVTATGFVGPNESICDDSQGSWTDDDADAATGLYCVCPAGKAYIPSAGGCVH